MGNIPKSGPNINLGEALRVAAEDQFWGIRGRAVQSYASLEQSLCRLFAKLSGTTDDVAGTIFFPIGGHVRSRITERLVKRGPYDQYALFFKSLLKELRTIDGERNEIVHWNVINHVSGDADGGASVNVSLRPPDFMNNFRDRPEKDSQSLLKFMEKCGFFARLINIFLAATAGGQIAEADREPWLSIFQQTIVYPPPAGHPLSLKLQAREGTPSQSSPD